MNRLMYYLVIPGISIIFNHVFLALKQFAVQLSCNFKDQMPDFDEFLAAITGMASRSSVFLNVRCASMRVNDFSQKNNLRNWRTNDSPRNQLLKAMIFLGVFFFQATNSQDDSSLQK